MNFNKRLKNIRNRAQITQKVISEHLGITIRTYQRYEEGTIEPPLATVIAIAKFFDMPLDCLLCNDFFSNWDELLLHRETLLLFLKEKILSCPEDFDLSTLTESQLAHILPAIFAKITLNGNEISVYSRIPADMFPISIHAGEL